MKRRISKFAFLAVAAVAAGIAAMAFFHGRTKPLAMDREEESAPAKVAGEPSMGFAARLPADPVFEQPQVAGLVGSQIVEEEIEGLREDAVASVLEDVSETEEAEVAAVEEIREGEERPLPPVSSETLAFVRETFAKWRESEQDEAATADLRLALAGELSREETLATAATLMKSGTVQDKLDALWAVANEFGMAPGEEHVVLVKVSEDGEDGTEEAEWTEEDERDAQETHDVVELVSRGFEDADPLVQEAAYEAAMALPPERNSILLGQLLCSDSAASAGLRKQLMDELEGETDDEAVTLFVAAMQSPDAATAAAAKKNMENLAGRTFADALEVADWLERLENEAGDGDEAKPF